MIRKLFKIILFLGLTALALWGGVRYLKPLLLNSAGRSKTENEIPDRLYTVKQIDLSVGINQGGNITSREKHKLSLEAAVKTTLLWVVEENEKVKKEDVLAKFEKEDLLDKIEELRLNLDNTVKEIMIAKEERKILTSTNEAGIRTAKDKVFSAEEAMRKYHRFEKHKEKDSLTLKVEQAEKAKEDAESAYLSFKDELASKSFKNQDEEEKDKKQLKQLKQQFDKAVIDQRNAELDLKVYKRYDKPNKMTQLANALAQAKLDLNKVKIQSSSRLIQKDKAISNLEKRKRQIERQLEDHESYVPMMRLVSPVDGVVVYGDPDRRWGNPDIKVGMDVRRKQVLLTIPDMSKLVVEFDLPEQFRSKVKVGDKAVITPDSLKNVTLTGKVKEIASLPVHQIFWDRSSPKIYKSTIELDKQNPKLVAGMSAQVEIVTKTLKDVLVVPIEAIFEKEGQFHVYKKSVMGTPKKASVEIGLSNDNFVHVREGLSAGDVIYLYKPFSRKDQT